MADAAADDLSPRIRRLQPPSSPEEWGKRRRLDDDFSTAKEGFIHDGGTSRQAAAQAYSSFMDSMSNQLEAAYSQEKQEACRKIEVEQAKLRQALEDEHFKALAQLQADHKAAEAEWESMLARCKSDGKLFSFSVRGCEGPQLSGSIPRQVFSAEPDSALAHLYDGEWEYATDDKGRAIVNSDPAHWPVVVNWLSFGTIPKNPSDELISECKYWQLERLLDAISKSGDDECFKIHDAVVGGHHGFKASGTIQRFGQRFASAMDAKTALNLTSSAFGRAWKIQIHQQGFHLQLISGPPAVSVFRGFAWGQGAQQLTWDASATAESAAGTIFGWELSEPNVRQLMHPQYLSVQGSMRLDVTVTFEEEKE